MFDVDPGEQADLIVKSNSSDGRTNRYWLRGSGPLDASYWDRYSHNVTDSQWMLIFCERNCPPWQSWFLRILTRPTNLKRTELLRDWLAVSLYFHVAKAWYVVTSLNGLCDNVDADTHEKDSRAKRNVEFLCVLVSFLFVVILSLWSLFAPVGNHLVKFFFYLHDSGDSSRTESLNEDHFSIM